MTCVEIIKRGITDRLDEVEGLLGRLGLDLPDGRLIEALQACRSIRAALKEQGAPPSAATPDTREKNDK